MENLKLLENKNGFIYIVEEGDTLNIISDKFNTTKRIIIAENNLLSEVKIGQPLFIKKGEVRIRLSVNDTFESLEKKYGVSKEQIMFLNKIDYLYPFELLLIK